MNNCTIAVRSAMALAMLILVVACDRTPEAATPGTLAAPGATASTAAARSAVNSDWACTLLQPDEVKAVLDVTPPAVPQAVVDTPDVSDGRCLWESGSSVGSLSVAVVEGHTDMNRMLIANSGMDGDPLPGVGDKASVSVQGDYDVEVNALVGQRRLTVNLNGLGAAKRRDAVTAAARAAAGRMR